MHSRLLPAATANSRHDEYHSRGALRQAVVPETGKATCLLADELSNVLWVGHADGRVTGHSLGDAPGTAINSQQLCCWQVGAAEYHNITIANVSVQILDISKMDHTLGVKVCMCMSLAFMRSALMSCCTSAKPPERGSEWGGEKGVPCWQAHRVGSVRALCRTPWGELWTGSSRGSVRVWDIAHLLDAPSEPGELLTRELRRHGGQRPHADTVSHIICPPGGQVDPLHFSDSLLWFSGISFQYALTYMQVV